MPGCANKAGEASNFHFLRRENKPETKYQNCYFYLFCFSQTLSSFNNNFSTYKGEKSTKTKVFLPLSIQLSNKRT